MSSDLDALKDQVLDAAAGVRTILLRGRTNECPCCGWSFRRFTRGGSGIAAKQNGYCPRCNSKPRHRWLWMHLPDSLSGAKRADTSVLHVAPAHSTHRAFRHMGLNNYITAGLVDSPRYDLRMDLNKPSLNKQFDVVVCVHVLEHVDDDNAAMAGLAQLMGQNGVALVGVPVRSGATLEDPSVIDPIEREAIFGEPDHRRWYGLDIVERLESAGFTVTTLLTDDAATEDRIRFGLKSGEGLFICHFRR